MTAGTGTSARPLCGWRAAREPRQAFDDTSPRQTTPVQRDDREAIDVGQLERPRYVYGQYSLHDTFVVLPEDEARQRLDEINRVKGCATVGQLRRVIPTLRHVWCPLDEESLRELGDDESLDWAQTSAAGDGDWPGMPDQLALDLLPEGLLEELIHATGAEEVDTIVNGPYLAIPTTAEAALLAVLHRQAGAVTRDDQLIEDLA